MQAAAGNGREVGDQERPGAGDRGEHGLARCGASEAPVGLACSGWQQNTRAPQRASAASSRSGRTPRRRRGRAPGRFAWYAGLARGGIARIGQVQLAQPVLSLVWAALVLGERIGAAEALTAAAVLACVIASQKARA